MGDDVRAGSEDAGQADHFLVGRLPDRMPDRGPRYKETPPDHHAPTAPPVAEPWNAVTAALFVVIVIGWVVRLRGRLRDYPFLAGCLPILLAGGVGGTLYHAYRTRLAYFLLDVIPIQLLGLAGSIYLTTRLVHGAKLWRVLGIAVGLLVVFAAVNEGLFRLLNLPLRNLRVNLNYAALALIILVPLGVVLVRTRFRHVGWVAGGLASFAIAWFCRLIDGTPYDTLPMGTHWLWHTFGAVTTQATMEYFYRIEGEGAKAHG
ncbi:MAG: hypothetical protein U0871_24650 [Gemmataceae bacterium]